MCWVRKSHMFQGVFPVFLQEVMKWLLLPGGRGHKSGPWSWLFLIIGNKIVGGWDLGGCRGAWWETCSKRRAWESTTLLQVSLASGAHFLLVNEGWISWKTQVSSPHLRSEAFKNFPLKCAGPGVSLKPLGCRDQSEILHESPAFFTHLFKDHKTKPELLFWPPSGCMRHSNFR